MPVTPGGHPAARTTEVCGDWAGTGAVAVIGEFAATVWPMRGAMP